ncbi:MAG: response regulator [Bacteroidia bacterium]|nr:response regulator [Bacteroidia bacterium]
MVNIKESDINIYLVDDDELLNKILRTKFEQTGDYKIYSFASGEEFIEFINKNPFNKRQIHIAILDYLFKSNANPQGKNGIEILKNIRVINPDIEVIMLSGIDDIDIATHAIKCGAVSFIKKNENSFLRIQNNVKFIISEKRLKLTKSQSFSTRVLFLTLTVIVALLGIYYVLTEFIFN